MRPRQGSETRIEVQGSMSIGATIDPSRHTAPNAAPELVQATRDEIRKLTREIAELSQQTCSPDAYFSQFLQRVITALASVAGAVWSVEGRGRVRAAALVNAPVIDSQDAGHQQLLQQIVATGRPIALAPQSTAADLEVTNRTDHLLLLAPLKVEGRVTAVIEVRQRPHRGPATERGYMAYLIQVGELAELFLMSHRLRTLRAHHDWSCQLEQFVTRIHSHLSVDDTAYCVVNEARRLAEVDRVSLAVGTARHCRVTVVSGLDNVDRRAEQVRQLGRLSGRVAKGREPIWLQTHSEDLAPQIAKEWNRYIDISHVRRCIVIPLFAPQVDEDQSRGSRSPATRDPFGALIFEQLVEEGDEDLQRERIEQICRHSTSALHNARQHEALFLLPVWRGLGKLCDLLGGRHFLMTLLLCMLLLAAAYTLIATKTTFTIPVQGKLQPETRRTVFAREAGIVTDVRVEHGQFVEEGEVLAELRNTDLDVEIMSLVGKQTATQEQILSLQRALLDDPRLETAGQNRLNGELLQLQQVAQSTERQLQLLRQKESNLVVRADRAGQVVTWHVHERILHRPVEKGQALMAIVDPDAPWELELLVPAKHSGYVLDASRNETPPTVDFVLSSHPGQIFTGTLKVIDHVAIDDEELGSVVRARVAIDASALPELKTDATVAAKINCGQRSLGFAWFHDLFDMVQSRVLFWF